jgi:hypothetical protein
MYVCMVWSAGPHRPQHGDYPSLHMSEEEVCDEHVVHDQRHDDAAGVGGIASRYRGAVRAVVVSEHQDPM